jgi:hypothetical protein
MIENRKLRLILLVSGFVVALMGCTANPTPDSTPSPSEVPETLQTTQTVTVEQPTMTPTIFTIATSTQDVRSVTETPVVQTKAVTTAGQKTDFYKYVGQNYPDKLKVTPGAVLTITWAIKNVGTIGWTTDYTIRYFSGITAKRDYYPFPQTVPANGVVNLSVTITAPKTLGEYTTWWKLTNALGQNFGDVDFTFEVSNSK